MARLVVLTEGFKGQSCNLKSEKITIGRAEDNSFCIPEPSVSGHHCEIFLRGSDIVVKDLNSTNGTYINDEQITEAVLKPGQTLRLGMVELQLENGNAPASATAPPSTKKTTVPVRPPAGVKIDELERPKPLGISPNSPFKKKTNKVNLIFAGIGIVLAILVIIFLVIAITKTGHSIHP